MNKRLREFVASSYAFQEILKEILQAKKKKKAPDDKLNPQEEMKYAAKNDT